MHATDAGLWSPVQQAPDPLLSDAALLLLLLLLLFAFCRPCHIQPGLSPQHRDCYMFHATSENVIDNTCMGNTSRFTNHCCSPCLYVKVLELQGDLHLCFFAKKDIRAGQELTFDYR
jgi:hypothetical protein